MRRKVVKTKSNAKSNKKSFLIIISVFLLIPNIFTLSNKPIQLDLNENSINHPNSKSLKLEISGSIIENPIFINGSATGLNAHNWTWVEEQAWCNGSGTINDPYVIENLFIDGKNQSSCIEIHNSAKFLIIRECTVFNSSESSQDAGIFLENVSNSILIDNECNYNAYGLFMEECSNNNITGNSANFNTWAGFHLSHCDNNTISNNIANNNVGVEFESIGIYLNLCHFNLVSENTANNNKYGIWL
ncbi:MAG: NosD domain-containing protein, partial [Promethearchaeota archaeon]